MNRRFVKSSTTFGVLFVSCILVNSCMIGGPILDTLSNNTSLHVPYMIGGSTSNIFMLQSNVTLHVPANFDIKVTGNTVYAYNNKDIHIGQILKQNIEDNIRSSIDKQSKYQYAIIINILGDNGIVSKYPSIYCDIKIYSEATNNTEQKNIDELLFQSGVITSVPHDRYYMLFPLGFSDTMSYNFLPYIIKDCSQKITNTLNYIFYNAENPKKFLTSTTYPTKISTEQFIIGKSTNIDILRKMNKPTSKSTYIYNNEKIYKYWYSDNDKVVLFTFDYNNILSNISFYKINRKYELLNIKQNPEIKINIINMIHTKKKDNYELLNKILSKITIGTPKGSLFRIMGKPDFCLESSDEEIWGFVGDTHYSIHIILKNNTVIDGYICENNR